MKAWHCISAPTKLCVLAMFALVGTACAPGSNAMSPTPGTTSLQSPSAPGPSPSPTSGPDPARGAAVGPLFPNGIDSGHGCTASVLDSAGGDLLLTAAHCLVGSGAGMEFVPGYRNGAHPEGTWEVQRAWADSGWLTDQDPRHDYAILQVEREDPATDLITNQRLPAGFTLGAGPAAGTAVEVTGYTVESDEPISCRSSIQITEGFPGFDCAGFDDGVSGSPLVVRTAGQDTVVGVIGGLHDGGCVPEVSYSSPFGSDVQALLRRAASGAPGDLLPPGGSDEC